MEELLGAIEVLEPVLTEIPERNILRQLAGDQLARRARDQHLPTMSAEQIRAARWTSKPT